MNEESPYQAPLPQGPPYIPQAMVGEPPAVKVFGILHLVLAGVGSISAIWGLFIAIIGNPFMKLMPSTPEMKAHLEAQEALQAQMLPLTITSSIISLLVAVPMIIAGVKLLKKRKDGLKWSNIYAWSSIAAKMITLVLTATIAAPAMKEMSEGLMKSSGAPSAAAGAMSGVMTGAAAVGVLISCTYAIVTLVVLNRPATKAWFASRPK